MNDVFKLKEDLQYSILSLEDAIEDCMEKLEKKNPAGFTQKQVNLLLCNLASHLGSIQIMKNICKNLIYIAKNGAPEDLSEAINKISVISEFIKDSAQEDLDQIRNPKPVDETLLN
jgi:hypothetical protein